MHPSCYIMFCTNLFRFLQFFYEFLQHRKICLYFCHEKTILTHLNILLGQLVVKIKKSSAYFSLVSGPSSFFSLWASSLPVGMRQAHLRCNSSYFGAKNEKRQRRELNLGLGAEYRAPYHCVAPLLVIVLITIDYYIMIPWFYPFFSF